jgi:hypothetical protein
MLVGAARFPAKSRCASALQSNAGAMIGRGGKSIMVTGAAGGGAGCATAGGGSAATIAGFIKTAHAAHANRSRDFMFPGYSILFWMHFKTTMSTP